MSDHPQAPNPWSPEIEQSIQSEDAMPVCVRCFTPQEHHNWFCPDCGAATGPFNNCMPFLYLYSEGEVLRSAVNGQIKPTWLTVSGYFLLSAGAFNLFAPFYWYRLYHGFEKYRQTQLTSEVPQIETGGEAGI